MEEQPQDSWTFQSEESTPDPIPQSRPHHEPITWSGSEFIAQHKSGGWYVGVGLGMAAACVLIYILSRDILSIIFVAIGGILFAIIASKQPRQLQYILDDQGLSVGQRHYLFSDFKSFSVMHDGAIGYISLLPLQRLRPELAIYFAPEDEQRIFETLSTYLPYQQRAEATVDKFAKRIRF